MVYWSDVALEDLNSIFIGLLNWQTSNGQRHLTYEAVIKYHNDLFDALDRLDSLVYHHKPVYYLHKIYGEYVYRYKRNARTVWYACYNLLYPDAYINRLISNYFTRY